MHTPTLDTEIPGESMIIIGAILKVATFDIPYADVDTLFGGNKNFPKGSDSIAAMNSPNLEQSLSDLGYESRHMSDNMGSVFLIILLTTAALILLLVWYPLIG